jgi:hypothetical protein
VRTSSGDTLASLAKRKLAESSAGPQMRGRWIQLIGEESVTDEFLTYYCAVCGHHALILDTLIATLPVRNSDQARVMAFAKHDAQLVLDKGPCVKIKR